MKLTESRLRSIIREELSKLNEKTTADETLEHIKYELEKKFGYDPVIQNDRRRGSVLKLQSGTEAWIDASVVMVSPENMKDFDVIDDAAGYQYQVLRA